MDVPCCCFTGWARQPSPGEDNIGPLSEAFRVYALDLPGHGDSDKPDIDYDPDEMVRFVVGFAESLSLHRPAIIGNSIGGALGLMTALQYPELVSALVLVDSAGLGREVTPYLRLVSVPVLGGLLESSRLGGTRFMLYNRFSRPGLRDPGAVGRALQEPKDARRQRGRREGRQKDRQHLGRPPALHPDRQAETPWRSPDAGSGALRTRSCRYHTRIGPRRRAPDARLQVFDPCGHWPHMERASEFNSSVLSFLSP